MKYYDLFDDMRIPGRWHLRMPIDVRGEWIDTWQFKEGRVLEFEGPIRFPVKPAGIALDFSLAMGVPVVHRRVVSLFERHGFQSEVQFIPAEVEGQPESRFILNALRVIRCIDDARCEEVFHWKPEDGEPDRVGQYKNVRGLRVDPQTLGAAHLLRPWGWQVVLLVSERLKQAMEAEGITGTQFVEV